MKKNPYELSRQSSRLLLMDFAAVVANLREYENIENDGCVYMFTTEPNIRDNKP